MKKLYRRLGVCTCAILLGILMLSSNSKVMAEREVVSEWIYNSDEYDDFIQDYLLPQYGVSYLERYEKTLNFKSPKSDMSKPDRSGLLGTYVMDWNQDGENELLAFIINSDEQLCLNLYSDQYGETFLVTSEVLDYISSSSSCVLRIGMKEVRGVRCLFVESTNRGDFATGITLERRIYSFDGDSIVLKYQMHNFPDGLDYAQMYKEYDCGILVRTNGACLDYVYDFEYPFEVDCGGETVEDVFAHLYEMNQLPSVDIRESVLTGDGATWWNQVDTFEMLTYTSIGTHHEDGTSDVDFFSEIEVYNAPELENISETAYKEELTALGSSERYSDMGMAYSGLLKSYNKIKEYGDNVSLEENINEVVSRNADYMDLYFAMEDLDGNGTKELMIGSEWGPIDAFTYSNGQIYRLLDCVWERCGIDICENGILHFYGSGGAAYHYDKYYKMADDGYSVEMIDSFYIDSEENVVTLIDGSVIPFQGNYDTFGNSYSSADLNWLRLSPENAESVTGYSWDMVSGATNDEILLAPCYE